MLTERLKSIQIALKGIFQLILEEDNAKVHLAAMFIVILAGWYFRVSSTEWCLLILCFSTVLSAEAMNTGLENLTDLVSPGHHKLAGKAKDFAAAAVLLSAIGAAVVGCIIFLPKIMALL